MTTYIIISVAIYLILAYYLFRSHRQFDGLHNQATEQKRLYEKVVELKTRQINELQERIKELSKDKA